MSYLTTEEFESTLDNVSIFPVTSVELGDISQFFLNVEMHKSMSHF